MATAGSGRRTDVPAPADPLHSAAPPADGQARPRVIVSKRIDLRSLPDFVEGTLEEEINKDPSILGLGPLTVIERQRSQENAGILDLLLEDEDQTQRFEVELMLGKTDESHIVRCIEYWDIERRRYPGYQHIAVLVAEDVTSRFINLLSLFSGTIPLVVLQLWATKVGDQLLLSFIKILDQRALRVDDTSDAGARAVDRAYWLGKSSQEILQLADSILEFINRSAGARLSLNYKIHYVGLKQEGTSSGDNFVLFRPKKTRLEVHASVEAEQSWVDKLTEGGVDAKVHREGRVRLNIVPAQWEKQRGVVTDLIAQAVKEHGA
jgi:hypothetical protein